MTTTDTEVTQEAREAAADYLLRRCDWRRAELARSGAADASDEVQAFAHFEAETLARHRNPRPDRRT